MNESRSVVVRLRVEMEQWKKSWADAVHSADVAKAKLAALNQSLLKNSRAWDQVGSTMLRVGAAAGTGVGVAIKAAVDWETAWAGVTKTTSGTAKQMGELEHQLREMATTMPATHQEIAATAEAAGQLGVARKDIAEFTKVMVMLGETTNLTADEAATSMQQFMNIMGTAPSRVGKLGSALVALGNNGASTEKQIIDMAQRIAGAGRIAGLTEANVLSLANGIASTGINAELGGTAMSKVLIKISKDVATNSSNLATWGKTSDMTAKQFADTWRSSPTQAISAFIAGLSTQGQKGFVTLSKLGLSGANVSQTLLNMAGSSDKLQASLKLGDKAITKTSALTKEYEKRNKTAAAEIQKSWNSIKDSLIDVGTTALPAIKELAHGVSTVADAFGDLPTSVQASALRAAALGTVLSGVGYVGIRTARNFSDLAQSLSRLTAEGEGLTRMQLFRRGGIAAAGLGLAAVAPEAHKASDALGVLNDAASGALLGFGVGGPWGAAIGGGIGALGGLVVATRDAGDANKSLAGDVDALVATLDRQTGAVTKDTEAWIRNKLVKSGAVRDADKLGVSVADLTAGAGGDQAARRRALDAARNTIEQTRTELANAHVAPDVTANVLKPLEDAYARLTTVIGGTSDALKGARTEFAESAQVAYAQAGAFGQVANTLGELFGGAERYVGVLQTVPADVQTRVSQDGAQASQADVIALAQAYDKTPAQVMTALVANDLATGKLRVVNGQLTDVNGRVVTPTVTADITKAHELAAVASDAINAVQQGHPATIVVDARRAIADTQKTLAFLAKIKPEYSSTITTIYKTKGSPPPGYKGIGATKDYATGGAVHGPGTGTSDSIAARLSNGEHVWTAAEVQAAGGQDAVYALRAAVRKRSLASRYPARKFANGGAVSGEWADSFESAATRFATPTYSQQIVRVSAPPVVLPELEATLVSDRVRIDKDGALRLIDRRVALGIAKENKYRSKR